MGKITKLSVVEGTKPPLPLGDAGMALWAQIQSEYEVTDAPGREMLFQLCSARDLAETCRAAGDSKTELQARSFVARWLEKMGFDAQPARAPGRPPGTFGRGSGRFGR